MKSIILAAGLGARMRPYTNSIPKAMLEVGGQTIIERIIKILINNGVSDICVVTGYYHEQLENYLAATFSALDLTFVRNTSFDKTNNIYSMHLAFENYPIDDDIILIESDLIITESVFRRILESPYKNVALVDRYKVGMDGTVVTIENDLITNIIPPHLQGPDFDYANKYKTLNIYKFSKEFASTAFRKLLSFYATVYNDNCYYELILGILVYMRQEQIYACDVDGDFWIEVDDANDLQLANIAFGKESRLVSLDEAYGGFWNFPVLDFAFIRNMYFPTNAMLADMRYNLAKLLQNYGSTQKLLNTKLAHFLLVPTEHVCLLNGLSQIYPLLERMIGDKLCLLPEPTFGEYSRVFKFKTTYQDTGYQVLNEISEEKIQTSEVIIIVNPNNPTGSYIESEKIFDLARSNPNKLFIVDESFIEFSGKPSVQDLLQKEELRNVWVLKSLSKSLGIPGLRIGYIYSRDDEVIQRINQQIPIWNSNSLAEYFLEIILKYRKELINSFDSTRLDRSVLEGNLASLEYVDRVFPSQANFILLRLKLSGEQGENLRNYLIEKSFYVKDCSSKFDDGQCYLRIAVRLPEENLQLFEAMSEFKYE